MAVEPPETAEEETDKDTQDTAMDLSGLSQEEEVMSVEPAAAAAEEPLAQVATEAAFLAWVSVVGLSWTSLQ